MLAQVRKAAGTGVTEIAAALGVNSDAVKPVVAELLAAKQVRKTGQKRGTKYHAGRASSAAGVLEPAKRMAAKKKPTRKAAKKRATRKKAASKRPITKKPVAVVA